MSETWRPIPGHTRYEVSDLGRVRSLRRGEPKLMKPARNVRNEYRYLTVVSDEGKPWSIQVHRLVLLAFVGPKPDGMETRHLDGDTENNTLANLVYGTRLENVADKVLHGTNSGGPRGPRIPPLAADEMTLMDAASRLGRHINRVSGYCKNGILPAEKRRGVWVVNESTLASFTPPKRGRPAKNRLEDAA